jgi:hypothetical protein
MGAYDEAHWQTAVLEIKTGSGVLKRGTILATGSGADVGKLVRRTAGTEAQSYGVLLDPAIDTSAAFSNDASRKGASPACRSAKSPLAGSSAICYAFCRISVLKDAVLPCLSGIIALKRQRKAPKSGPAPEN